MDAQTERPFTTRQKIVAVYTRMKTVAIKLISNETSKTLKAKPSFADLSNFM